MLNKTRVYFCLNTLFNQGLHIYKNNFVGSRFSDALLTLVVPGVPTATWAHSGLILSNQRPVQVKSKPSMGRVKYKLLKTGDPNQHYTLSLMYSSMVGESCTRVYKNELVKMEDMFV